MSKSVYTVERIYSAFVKGDKILIGLDNGKTRSQMMAHCGDKNPDMSGYDGWVNRNRFYSTFCVAKKLFARDGFTIDNLKLPKKDTVFYIVGDPEERVSYHGKLTKRAINAIEKVRIDRLIIQTELTKVKDQKGKQLLLGALARRIK